MGRRRKGPVSGWLEVGLRAALPPSGQKQIERLMGDCAVRNLDTGDFHSVRIC